MVTYPDTSFIFPLYVSEATSETARRFLDRARQPLPFTPLHRLELRTGLRGRVYRRALSQEELKQALRLNEQQLADDILRHTPLIWAEAFREAERLGELYAAETGVRSADLLHVASAVVLGARNFVTFDQRQTKLAQRAGLKVPTWQVR